MNKVSSVVSKGYTKEELDSVFSLGANYLEQGKFKKAEIIFEGLFALDQGQKKIALALGEALLMSQKGKSALSHFEKAIAHFEPCPRLLFGAARACLLMQDILSAKSYLEKIGLCSDKEFTKTMNNAKVLLEKINASHKVH